MGSRLTERPTRTAGDASARGGRSPVSARSRRAFTRRQWGRRWARWRLALLALVVLALLVGAGWLVFFSPHLAVRTVTVSGPERIREEVLAAAAVEEGQPLARVDLDTVGSRVRALADVRSATVTRRWPDSVSIRVEERVPVAVVEIGGRLRGLDADGVVFRDYARPPRGLPRVQTPTDTGREALLEAAAVVASLPDDLLRQVDHVEVATVDQISLALRDDRTVVWGSAEESDAKAEVLLALLEQPGETYDVSVPGQPTVRQ